MQKNAKFGCFDHLGFHQIHVFELYYTKQWLDKAIFDQRKNNFFAQNWPWWVIKWPKKSKENLRLGKC